MNLCACIGPCTNPKTGEKDPYCPCAMHNRGLIPWIETEDGRVYHEAKMVELKVVFERLIEEENDD